MAPPRHSCFVYIQLFFSWLVLLGSTVLLCVVPESAVFYGLSDNLNNVDNVVIFGVIVMTEAVILIVLLVVAMVLVSRYGHVTSALG